MNLGLQDKVAIVTGGAAGIGKATVEVLLEEGAKVVVINKDAQAFATFYQKLNALRGSIFYACYDLTNDENCEKTIRETVKYFGGLDILVNNAGGNDFKPIDTTSPAEFRKSLDVNLVMPYAMSFYAWPELKKTQGKIVFVGSKVSIAGEGAHGGTIAYAAAKGGVNGLTRELATISARENLGIRVNCILPGKVDTYIERVYGPDPDAITRGRIAEGADIPFQKRLTTPREIAYAIAFLASNEVSGHTTGEIWSPDGGYVHLDRLAHLSPVK